MRPTDSHDLLPISIGIVVVVCSALACNGTNIDTNLDGELSLSPPKNKAVAELPSPDAETMCTELTSYRTDKLTAEEVCELQKRVLPEGVPTPQTDKVAAQVCRRIEGDCDENTPDQPETPSKSCIASYTQCEVTVAQVEDCAEDRVRQLENIADSTPTCSEVTANFYNAAKGQIPDPPESCRTVRSKCRALYEAAVSAL
ncbi:MAG: hypothetical protein ABEL76_05570 [Bradymonadaceae bacterium]